MSKVTGSVAVNINHLFNTSNSNKEKCQVIQGDTKKRELLKNPTKIEEIQEKKKLFTEIEPLQLAF